MSSFLCHRGLLPMASHLFTRSANAAHVRQTIKTCSSICRGASDSTTPKTALENNPYFEKYKDSIEKKLREMEEKGETVELPSLAKKQKKAHAEKTPGSDTADVRLGSMAQAMHGAQVTEQPQSASSERAPPSSAMGMGVRSLDSVMHLDLIKGKTADEIEQIWKEYHKTKDGINAIIPSDVYQKLHSRAERCRRFIFPLPRQEGYEFFYCEFMGHQFQLTSLLNFKSKGENAPPALTLIHFTELQEDKGIVLMFGEVDVNCMNVLEAQCLGNQLKTYYMAEEGSQYYKLLEQFNFSPTEFDHNEVLTLLQDSGMSLLTQQDGKEGR